MDRRELLTGSGGLIALASTSAVAGGQAALRKRTWPLSFETRGAPISKDERNLLFLDRANGSEKHRKYGAGLSMGQLLLRGTFVEKWRFLKSRQRCVFSNLNTVGPRKRLVAEGGHEIGAYGRPFATHH